MRAYFGTTGVVFTLVTLLHLARTPQVIREAQTEPWSTTIYTALTVLAAALAVWAWRMYRRAGR